MARRAREIDKVPLPKKPSSSSSSSMLACGRAHELHAVGKLLGETGARASMCGIVGSYYEPPPRSDVPVVPRLLPRSRDMNELEVRAAILDALRSPGPCDECEAACGFGDVGPNPWAERLARAIEDGDVTIKVMEGAWL